MIILHYVSIIYCSGLFFILYISRSAAVIPSEKVLTGVLVKSQRSPLRLPLNRSASLRSQAAAPFAPPVVRSPSSLRFAPLKSGSLSPSVGLEVPICGDHLEGCRSARDSLFPDHLECADSLAIHFSLSVLTAKEHTGRGQPKSTAKSPARPTLA